MISFCLRFAEISHNRRCVAARDLGYTTFEFEHAIDSDAISIVDRGDD